VSERLLTARKRLEAVLAPELVAAVEALVDQRVSEALASAGIGEGGRAWLSVEQTAELLRTSPGAIRQRISTGWLAGDTVCDGRRRFVRREAVIRELERRSKRL
jgi:hypothetical protein